MGGAGASGFFRLVSRHLIIALFHPWLSIPSLLAHIPYHYWDNTPIRYGPEPCRTITPMATIILLFSLKRLAISLCGSCVRRTAVHDGFLRELLFDSSINTLSNSNQIIMFSDLECDYINPIDLCNKLNQVRESFLFIWFANGTHFRASVCSTRKHHTRIPRTALPPLRAMDSFPTKRSLGRVQCKQVSCPFPSGSYGLI